MKTVRLIRSVDAPTGRGPGNGQHALQRALRACQPPWLEIGGELQPGEIPWVWSYEDAGVAIECERQGREFVCGPNVFFGSSARPGEHLHERILLDARNCVLQFTESDWYADLIRQHCRGNIAPIAIWSYPIDPQPAGPLPAEIDVLVYLKRPAAPPPVVLRALERWGRRQVVKTIHYGLYQREELIDAARRARCCLYVSDDDRGPLALAEILLAGCPAVGVPRGAPWIVPGTSGYVARNWRDAMEMVPVVARLDRQAVRAWAVDRFVTERTVRTILTQLESIAGCV